ncbi:uncharacterized protein An01g06510 [Aspergillus niger]|uniref:Contig An01c0240, genomic contig n=2 Tax=Aspergillus niger TaxID=5061 RepID=A2Q937_ASPNC|nr:uncharacterized protein An01g06510 [Aspergillus niger]CAK43771.1 unnamed protein product [Aspergillus niger]
MAGWMGREDEAVEGGLEPAARLTACQIRAAWLVLTGLGNAIVTGYRERIDESIWARVGLALLWTIDIPLVRLDSLLTPQLQYPSNPSNSKTLQQIAIQLHSAGSKRDSAQFQASRS